MEVEPGRPLTLEPVPEAVSRRQRALRLLLLWLLATNLRASILAVPPVLPTIHRQLHLSETEVGLLTTPPILLLGVGSIGGSAAVARLGARRTLVVGILVVGIASALRGAGGTATLFGASVLLGLAISVVQPALPSVTHSWFGARVGIATALYGNGFMVGEAVAASITLPLVLPLVGSWQAALEAWGIPCVVVVLLFLTPAGVVPAFRRGDEERIGWSPKLGDRRTWRLGLLQGGGSVIYFGLNAFLPTELHAVGHPSLVSPCLAALNITQILAAVLIGLLARRGVKARPVMALCGLAAPRRDRPRGLCSRSPCDRRQRSRRPVLSVRFRRGTGPSPRGRQPLRGPPAVGRDVHHRIRDRVRPPVALRSRARRARWGAPDGPRRRSRRR